MRRHNFTFENFVQENCQKVSKHAQRVGKNVYKKVQKMNKIMSFSVCTYKSPNFVQGQRNFALSHDGEKVIFKNSAIDQ